MGYVKIDRKLLDNPIWANQPFSVGQAWIDLIMIADYETKKKKWKNKDVWFKRGTVNASLQSLGSRWGWDRFTVRRFLDRLVEENMVTIETYNKTRTVITILNYDRYQDAIKRRVNAPKTEQKKLENAPKSEHIVTDSINWDDIPEG